MLKQLEKLYIWENIMSYNYMQFKMSLNQNQSVKRSMTPPNK